MCENAYMYVYYACECPENVDHIMYSMYSMYVYMYSNCSQQVIYLRMPSQCSPQNFRHADYVHTYICTYVCTCMSPPDIHMFIRTRTNAAQMLAASVLGTSIEFYKRRHLD